MGTTIPRNVAALLLFALLIVIPDFIEAQRCKINEVYSSCFGDCQKSCDNPNTFCPVPTRPLCGRGCICREGYVRRTLPRGRCILPSQCPKKASPNPSPGSSPASSPPSTPPPSPKFPRRPSTGSSEGRKTPEPPSGTVGRRPRAGTFGSGDRSPTTPTRRRSGRRASR